MPTQIPYKVWFDSVVERIRELEAELAHLQGVRNDLAPLADADDPMQYSLVSTPGLKVERESLALIGSQGVYGGPDEMPHLEPPPVNYRKMSSMEAALDFMRRTPEPQKTGDIARALRRGGFPTSSPNFTNNVYTTMRRLAEDGLAERIGQGLWRLTPQGMNGTRSKAAGRNEQVDLVR